MISDRGLPPQRPQTFAWVRCVILFPMVMPIMLLILLYQAPQLGFPALKAYVMPLKGLCALVGLQSDSPAITSDAFFGTYMGIAPEWLGWSLCTVSWVMIGFAAWWVLSKAFQIANSLRASKRAV